jgi:hypothetical protein
MKSPDAGALWLRSIVASEIIIKQYAFSDGFRRSFPSRNFSSGTLVPPGSKLWIAEA